MPTLLPYRLLLLLLTPLLLFYTLNRARKDGGWRYLRQRFGAGHPKLNRPIWLHCASVGEINAALPLIQELHRQNAKATILVTTNTPTGAEVLQKRLGERVQHAYLPLDLPGPLELFLSRIRPRCALIMETEIWPNLYELCSQRRIPLSIINARLSHKTLDSNWLMRQTYRRALSHTRAILARSQADVDGFCQLGAAASKIELIGNIKFALPAQTDKPSRLIERRYLIAASTHDDEELRIAKLWQPLQADHPETLLVIAPRHPERREQILSQLKSQGLNIALRSRGEPITANTQLYLADTLGELNALMAHAELVLMGGSLIPHGGQNLLEPARLGRAILCGPHMFNFSAEVERFLQQQAIIQVNDETDLSQQLRHLLDNPAEAAKLGQRAATIMQQEHDIVVRYLKALRNYCPLSE